MNDNLKPDDILTPAVLAKRLKVRSPGCTSKQPGEATGSSRSYGAVYVSDLIGLRSQSGFENEL
jgi:hypothetical protein